MTNSEENPVQVSRGLPTEQRPMDPPVIGAPHLPTMEKLGAVKTGVRTSTLLPLMGSGTPLHGLGSGVMEAVPPQRPPTNELPMKPQEPKGQGSVSNPAEGYVRLEVHADNGKLSIVGVKRVPGPLAMPTALIRGYAYEVLVDDQQVALGSLPDMGVMRAFANRDVEGPQGKHHFATLPTFNFSVRIPSGHISTANLPKLNIVLHKVEDAPDRITSLAPLGRQTGVKTVEVGRLTGISMEQLSVELRPQFQRILLENDRLR